jgi:hypothetical protein
MAVCFAPRSRRLLEFFFAIVELNLRLYAKRPRMGLFCYFNVVSW